MFSGGPDLPSRRLSSLACRDCGLRDAILLPRYSTRGCLQYAISAEICAARQGEKHREDIAGDWDRSYHYGVARPAQHAGTLLQVATRRSCVNRIMLKSLSRCYPSVNTGAIVFDHASLIIRACDPYLRNPSYMSRPVEQISVVRRLTHLRSAGFAEGRDKYGCFFFNERRAVELTVLLGVGPTVISMFKLIKVRDVFGIGPEIVHVIIPMLIGGGTSCSSAQRQRWQCVCTVNDVKRRASNGLHYSRRMVRVDVEPIPTRRAYKYTRKVPNCLKRATWVHV